MDMSLDKFWDLGMDKETWYAVVHGVSESRTRLKGLNGTEEKIPVHIDQTTDRIVDVAKPVNFSLI